MSSDSSHGPETRRLSRSTRRAFVGIATKIGVAASVAAGIAGISSSDTLAAYNTSVVANNAPGRGGPSASYGIIKRYACGQRINIDQVVGQYACSCNECTSYWGNVNPPPGSPIGFETYIHRGNLNPVYRGCECYY